MSKQLRINTTPEQVEAVARVAKERGISKGALVRDAIAAATGAPNTVRPSRWSGADGWAAINAQRSAKREES